MFQSPQQPSQQSQQQQSQQQQPQQSQQRLMQSARHSRSSVMVESVLQKMVVLNVNGLQQKQDIIVK